MKYSTRKSTKLFTLSCLCLTLITPLYAADIATATPTLKIATEYESVTTDTLLTSADIKVELGAEYAVNDTIKLTFTGADALVVDSLKSYVTIGAVPPHKAITLGLIDSHTTATATEVEYRVTDITGGSADSTTGVTLNFGGAEFTRAKVTDAGIQVSYSAQTNTGRPLDTRSYGATQLTTSAAATELFEFVDQYQVTVTQAFDAIVDLEQDRQALILANGTTTFTDSVRIKLAEETFSGNDLHTDYEGATLVLTGDFSWIKDTNTAAAAPGIQPLGGVVSVQPLGFSTCTLDTAGGALTSTTMTITCDDRLDTIDITLDTAANGNNVELPVTEYAVTATLDYSLTQATTLTSTTELANIDAGSWTLNGANVFIPYMPYSRADLDQVTQNIYLTNSGFESGEITLEVTSAAGVTTSFNNTALNNLVAAPGLTPLTDVIRDAMLSEGLLAAGAAIQPFAIRIIVNDAAESIAVYSSYTVNGADTGWVENNSIMTR